MVGLFRWFVSWIFGIKALSIPLKMIGELQSYNLLSVACHDTISEAQARLESNVTRAFEIILYVWPELINQFFKTTIFPQNEVQDGKIIEMKVVCTWGFDLKVDFDEVMEVTC
jgi:hypothetical protein